MAVPGSGSFKMYGASDDTTIEGAVIVGGGAGGNDFNTLIANSDPKRFDLSLGITSLSQVNNSIQYRNYPISVTPSITPTVTPSATPSVTPSATPSVTPSVTPSATPSSSPAVTPSTTPSVTATVTPTASPSISATPSLTPSTSEVACECVTVDILDSQKTSGGLDLYYIVNDCGGGTRDVNLNATIGVPNNGSSFYGICGSGTLSALFKYGPSGAPFTGIAGMNVNRTSTTCTTDGDCTPSFPTPTPTASPSVTPTRTPSVTPSTTPGGSAAASVTPTVTPSRTPSATPSSTPAGSSAASPTPSPTPSETPSSSDCKCIVVTVDNNLLTNGAGEDLYYRNNICGGGTTIQDENLNNSIGAPSGTTSTFNFCSRDTFGTTFRYGPSGAPFTGTSGMSVSQQSTVCTTAGDCAKSGGGGGGGIPGGGFP